MKPILATILTFCATGCATVIPTSGDGICDGTRQARAAHATALADTADAAVLQTGAALIAKLDAGCAK